MSKKDIQVEKSYILSSKSIDEISEETGTICNSFGMDSRDIYRHRLTVEECLLDYQRSGYEGNKIVLKTTRRFFQNHLELLCKGSEHDPLKSGESAGFGQLDLLSNLNLVPQYYRDGEWNVLRFRMNKKGLGSFTVLGLVIVISLLIGFGGKALLPDAVRDMLLTFIITPFYDIFFNVVRCLAGPMIFLAIAAGIYGIGDISTFGRIGRRAMMTYAAVTTCFAAIGVLSYPFFGIEIVRYSSAGGDVSDIIDMFKNIVPSSIVTPFAEGNILQIIFMAVVCGIAILYLDKQTGHIAEALEQANSMVQFVMTSFCKAIPFFMAILLINTIWTETGKQFSSTWKMFAVGTLFSIMFPVLAIILFSAYFHVKPGIILKKAMPGFTTAFITASSAATFQTNVATCIEKYGVDKSITGFGLPLGMVMGKATATMYYVIVSLFMASQYDIKVSIGWLIIAVVSCALVSMAVPPVPGGGTCVYMVIFAQLGIPAEAVAIAVAVEILMDYVTTAGDAVLEPLMLVKAADSIGAVDRQVLAE